ncbi:ABC transporter permease subunit [Methylomonas sp. AM2-LC]|uniref:ABC transporter permease subunit n=1 Tax=Methylomonas sp. AM2-LC TaxID=3153301 RepID=UPI0032642C51
MSEELSTPIYTSLIHNAKSDRHQRWRLLKDKLATYFVTAGGLSIILAIVLIFFYLLYVVFPLLLPAHAEAVNRYAVPEISLGKTLHLGMEEQNEIAVRFTETGSAVFFKVADGSTILIEKLPIPDQVQIVSFNHGSHDKDIVAYGLSDGRCLIVKHDYRQSFVAGKRSITPSLQYPLGKEPIIVDSKGAALSKIEVKLSEKNNVVVAKTSDNRIVLTNLSKKASLFDDEASLDRSETEIVEVGNVVDFILVDKELKNLYLANKQGDLTIIDIADKNTPTLKHKLNVINQGATITSMEFLNGDISLLIGDSSGLLSQWSMIRDEKNHFNVEKLRAFKISDVAVVAINAEQRRKGMLVADAKGNIGIYNTTAERELIKEQVTQGTPLALTLSPRANAFLMESSDGIINYWSVENEHPEVSMSSLWQKVWYESYSHPDYIWQSSSASNDFEPKMSLIPLVFGTIKASFYAMLVAVPLSLFGAIYTGYFMAPQIRQYVKPGIEIMGALPTVILGFLAGLWLAPFIELHLTGIFTLLIFVPLGVMIFSYVWQTIPKSYRDKIPEGWDFLLLIPVVIFSGLLAFQLSPGIDNLFFNGDLRNWMSSTYGIGYDQRNTLVVGLAMGFAVIPMIFSIAEDAIFSVPKHLTTGSLALGATPWQTMIKVVLLTASPGIFSAIMIGFGRAVGETMIVLMATGNTPVMDLSIFQGLRTLSANIAVEMPEAEVNSTHYRVLFFAALVLFMFTFIVNTLAEIVRQNLRQKYSSL